MQISRHWRLNAQRYRLQGVRYSDGSVSLQDRPVPPPILEAVIPALVRELGKEGPHNQEGNTRRNPEAA